MIHNKKNKLQHDKFYRTQLGLLSDESYRWLLCNFLHGRLRKNKVIAQHDHLEIFTTLIGLDAWEEIEYNGVKQSVRREVDNT